MVKVDVKKRNMSSWRPCHLSSSQNVEVKVVNRLGSVLAVIDHHSVTLLQRLFLGHVFGNNQQMTQKLSIIISGLTYSGNGDPGNDQEVNRGLRIYIPESQTLVIFINNISWNGFINDFGEDGWSRGAILLTGFLCQSDFVTFGAQLSLG